LRARPGRGDRPRRAHPRRSRERQGDAQFDRSPRSGHTMSGRTQINEFIQRFGKERDLALDPLNERGYAEIARGSAVVRANGVEEHGVLLMIAPIMRVPERNTEAFYR